jgi:hypothetical protein
MTRQTLHLIPLFLLLLTPGARAASRYPAEVDAADRAVHTWLGKLAHKSTAEVQAMFGAPDERTTWSASGHQGPKWIYHLGADVDLHLLFTEDRVNTAMCMLRVIE